MELFESQKIEGLSYLPDFCEATEQTTLLAAIDGQPWLTDLKRRVQHYGYRYNYSSRSVSADTDYLGDLPDWSQLLLDRLLREGSIGETPDQLIVNEYQPGQGISAHVDCVPCFGDTVFSLSLGSACVMEFSLPARQLRQAMLLEPGSLLIMRGQARYEWRHSIPAHQSDTYKGQTFQRQRRVSLTFRTVLTQKR